jgi:predicted DNA-binding ribbon-helix-helix protein
MRQVALKADPEEDEADADSSSVLSSLVVKSIRIHRRRTSVRLEPEMWQALYEVAAMEGLTIHDICARVDDTRSPKGTFSSALRVYLLRWYRRVAKRGLRVRLPRTTESAS